MVSRHRNHVDRRRNLIGNAISRSRLKEMEKLNRYSPVFSVTAVTGERYEIYSPGQGRGPRGASSALPESRS